MAPLSAPLNYLTKPNSSQTNRKPQPNEPQHNQNPNPNPNPNPKLPLNCPRCNSTNTKFCYYNNYSRLQPRHFCRACRRHWTAGGTLRDVPIGGGRKYGAKRRKLDGNYDNAPGGIEGSYDSTPDTGNDIGAGREMLNDVSLPLHNFPFGDAVFMPSETVNNFPSELGFGGSMNEYQVGPTWQWPDQTELSVGYWDEINYLI